MNFFAAMIALLLTPVAVAADADDLKPIPPMFASAQISLEQLTSLIAEVEAIPDVECRYIRAFQRQCSSASRSTIWTFTRPGHPAHPAVSRGVLVTSPNHIAIDRSGHFVGDEASFRKWMDEWAVVDKRQIQEFSQHPSK